MLKKYLLFLVCSSGFFLSALAQENGSLQEAQQLFIKGEYEAASQVYEKLYQQKNYRELALDGYVNSLIKLKAYDTAEKIIRKNIKDNASEPNLKVYLIQIFLEKGDRNNADKTFQELLQKLPADNLIIEQTANNLYRVNQYEYVIKVFTHGRKLLNDSKQFAFELINLYRYLRMKDQLTQELLEIIDTNPDYLPTAKANISRTYENDEDYQALKAILLKRIQKNTNSIELSDLLAWTYTQLKEYNFALIQTISIDKRTNGNGSPVFMLGYLLRNNLELEYARKAYDYLISKGSGSSYYIQSKIELVKLRQLQAEKSGTIKNEASSLAMAYSNILEEFGKTSLTLFAIRDLAKLQASYLDKNEAAESLLTNALSIPRLTADNIAEIKLDLADINILNNNPWEASLLYGQVEKSLPNTLLGQEAKFRNAKLSFYRADFKWAKAQLDVLKASTSQLIANDALDLSLLIQDHFDEDSTNIDLKKYARAEFLREQLLYDKALLTLDSILRSSPDSQLADDILLSKAKIYTSQNEIDKAIIAYKKLYEQYPTSIWTDDALYHLGVLYHDYLKDEKSASTYFEKLIHEFPGSLYITDVRKRFRSLRGDML